MQRPGDIVAPWRHSPLLRSNFLQLHMARNSETVTCDGHTLSKSRLSHLPVQWMAVIVRHRIVKRRLDDELDALDCLCCRRTRAWRDATELLQQSTVK